MTRKFVQNRTPFLTISNSTQINYPRLQFVTFVRRHLSNTYYCRCLMTNNTMSSEKIISVYLYFLCHVYCSIKKGQNSSFLTQQHEKISLLRNKFLECYCSFQLSHYVDCYNFEIIIYPLLLNNFRMRIVFQCNRNNTLLTIGIHRYKIKVIS